MKIYERLVIDMSSGEVVEEQSYDYSGPVVECKGGGSSTTVSVDKEYNARMAKIAEEHLEFSEEDRNLWRYGVTYNPNEQVSGYMKDGRFVEGAAPATQEVGYYDENNNWVSQDEWLQQRWDVSRASDWQTRQNPQYETVTKTRGELQGYDPSIMTQYDLEQMQIEANADLVPHQTQQAISAAQYGKAQTDAGMKRLPYQTQRAIAEEVLARNKAKAAGEVLPSQTQSQIAQNVYSRQQAEAGSEVLPYQTESRIAGAKYDTAGYEAGMEALPHQTRQAISEAQYGADAADARRAILPLQQKVGKAFYNKALGGINVDERVNQARADVGQSFAGAEQRTARALGGMGINPNSDRGRSEFSKTGLNYGRAISGASSAARRQADDDEFNRLNQAISTVR